MTVSAQAFAEEWVDAFNRRDLQRILSNYTADVELISPIYQQFTEGRSDVVRGMDDLRAYFDAALRRFPELHFRLVDVARGSRGLCIRYHTNIGDRIGMECFELDEHGKAARIICHYLPAG
jgi:hypothetical protein